MKNVVQGIAWKIPSLRQFVTVQPSDPVSVFVAYKDELEKLDKLSAAITVKTVRKGDIVYFVDPSGKRRVFADRRQVNNPNRLPMPPTGKQMYEASREHAVGTASHETALISALIKYAMAQPEKAT